MSDQRESGFGTGAVILSFFIGGIIGAGIALLTAPKSGAETRKIIKDFAGEAKDKAGEYIDQAKGKATSYIEKGKQFVDREKNIITKAVEAGKEAYDRERQG